MDTDIEVDTMALDLENDLYISGNLLILEARDIKSTNGTHTQSIASKVDGFVSLVSFTQLNNSHVVISDNGAYCLHIIDRISESVRPYVGICNSKGFANGKFSETQFSFLLHLIRGRAKTNHLIFLIDQDLNAVRYVDTNANVVGTAIESEELTGMTELTLDNEIPDTLLIFSSTYIRRVSIFGGNDVPSEIVHNNTNTVDGADGSFNEASLIEPYAALDIGSGIYLMSQQNGRLRVVDTASRKVSSICKRGPIQTGHISACQIPSSGGLAVKENTIYFGTEGKILQLLGKLLKRSKHYAFIT